MLSEVETLGSISRSGQVYSVFFVNCDKVEICVSAKNARDTTERHTRATARSLSWSLSSSANPSESPSITNPNLCLRQMKVGERIQL